MSKLNKLEIKSKMATLFEDEDQRTKDFVERNFDELAASLYEIEVEEKEFEDRVQEEIEKYEEYLAIE